MRKFFLSSVSVLALSAASAQAAVNYAAAGMTPGQLVTNVNQVEALYSQVVVAGRASGFLTEVPPVLESASVGFLDAQAVPIYNSSNKVTGWSSVEYDPTLTDGYLKAAMVASVFAHELSHVQTFADIYNADNLSAQEKGSMAEYNADMDAITYFTQDPQNMINYRAQSVGMNGQIWGVNAADAETIDSDQAHGTPYMAIRNIINVLCHACSADGNLVIPMEYANTSTGTALEYIDDGNLYTIPIGTEVVLPNLDDFSTQDLNSQTGNNGNERADNGTQLYDSGGGYADYGSGGCDNNCNY